MQQLTEQSVLFLRIMMSEPEFTKELLDGKDFSCFSRIDIDPETGSIVLGKTRFKWWNDFTGDKKEISLETFAFKAVAFLGAKGAQEGHGDKIAKGLLEDIADTLHRSGRSNDIIDRLFLIGYMCVKTTWSCCSLGIQGMQNNESQERNVNINVAGRTYRKNFVAKGLSDIQVELEIGPTGAVIH